MLKKLWIKLAIVPVLILMTASGCTSSNGSAGSDNLVESSALTHVLKTKVIKIATYTDTEPYAWKDSDGVLKGYDVDLAEALADALGAEIEWVVATDATRIPSLQSGKVDAVIASFTSNPERAQQVTFTRPYSTTGVSGITKKDSSIHSYADLDGKTVAVSRGSTADLYIKANFPNIKVQGFDNSADAYQAIRSGKVDATLDEVTLVGAVVANDDSLRFITDELLASAPISIGLKTGDPVWGDYLNNFVMNWIYSGDAAVSYEKWFQKGFPAVLK